MAKIKIDNFTGIRGLTALWVILFHTADVSTGDFWAKFASRGWLGVDVFFILSGFIIAHVYRQEMADFSWEKLRTFYAKRFARIYPAHFFILMLFLLSYLLARSFQLPINTQNYSWPQFFTNLFMLNGIGLFPGEGWNLVSWSISSEMLVYLLYPFLAIYLARLGPWASLLAILTIFSITFSAAWIVNEGRSYFLPWHLTSTRVTSEFFVGCLLYNLYGAAFLQRAAAILAPLLFVLIIRIAGTSLAPLIDGCLVILFSLFILAISCDKKSLLSKCLCLKPLQFLGEISYSLYLVQVLSMTIIRYAARKFPLLQDALSLSMIMPMIVVTLVSMLFAYFIFYYVEKYGQRRLLKLLLPLPKKI